MPTWKKVVISGSGIAQLSNDANYLIDAQAGAILTGSFSGSFVGDGSGLTNIVAPGTISASAQVVVQETTGFSGLQANISGSISDLSGSAHTQREALVSNLSGDISTLSGSAHTQREALVANLSGSAHDQRVAIESNLSGDISNLSGSAHDQRLAIESNLSGDISSLSGSAHTQRVAISASIAATLANNNSDLTTLIASQSEFDTAFTLSGSDVTVKGNLTVSGTTTTVNSTQIELGDNILALNGAASDFAGLKVNDSSGPASGSLLWDGVNNQWIAGGEGSEVKILLASGDNVVSGSSQITVQSTTGFAGLQANISGSISNLSGSAHTQREALVSNLSGDISTLSGSAHDQRVAIESNLSGDISSLSGSAHTQRVAIESNLSGDISSLSGSAHDQRVALSSSLKTYTDQKVAALVDGAPELLDTLNELAAAIGDDAAISASFATTLGTKASTTDVNNLSGSAHTQRLAIESSLSGDISSLSGSAHTQREALVSNLSASAATANTQLSASFASTVSGLSQTLSVSGSTGDADIDLLTQDLTIAGDGGGISTSISGTTVSLVSNGIISASVEGDAQGQIKLNGVNVDINALGTGDSPTFQNLVINGNLTTLGTVTNVNTTDLNIEDKFILLNSGSSSGNSGLIVQNSATIGEGTALFYDDTENRWALDHIGADAVGDTATADSYVAAVTTDDTDTNLQKNGNIYVDTVSGEAFIYVA